MASTFDKELERLSVVAPARPSWARKLTPRTKGPAFLFKFANGISAAVLCDSVGLQPWAVRLPEDRGGALGALTLDCNTLDLACRRLESGVLAAGGHWQEDPAPEVFALNVVVEGVVESIVRFKTLDGTLVEETPPEPKGPGMKENVCEDSDLDSEEGESDEDVPSEVSVLESAAELESDHVSEIEEEHPGEA